VAEKIPTDVVLDGISPDGHDPVNAKWIQRLAARERQEQREADSSRN
jgi:hypothetical protein